MFVSIRCGLLAAAFTAMPLAWAQSPRPAADPLDPTAAVPAAVHRSTLSAYRDAGELRVESWKDANERVTRIGGWRAYAREAASPASAPAATGHKH